jgi:hypothetical protein
VLKTARTSARLAGKDDQQSSGFDAAFKANLRRGFGGQKLSTKISAGVSGSKRAPEVRRSHYKRPTVYDGPTSPSERVETGRATSSQDGWCHENLRSKNNAESGEVPESFGYPSWEEELSFEEMKREYVEQLRRIRLNEGNEFRMPSMEEALKPLADAALSKEEFVSMTEMLLKNTSAFKEHILTPEFEREGARVMKRFEEVREVCEVARHSRREWQASARKRREELIASNEFTRYRTTAHEPSFKSLLLNDILYGLGASQTDLDPERSWIWDLYDPPPDVTPTELGPVCVKLFRQQGGPNYLPLGYSHPISLFSAQTSSLAKRLIRKLSGIGSCVRGRRETATHFFAKEDEGSDGGLIGRMQDKPEPARDFQANVFQQAIGRGSINTWKEGPGRSKDWKTWPRRAFLLGNAMGLAQQQISGPRLLTLNQHPLLYQHRRLKAKVYSTLDPSKNMSERKKNRLCEFRQEFSLADKQNDGGFEAMQVFPALCFW